MDTNILVVIIRLVYGFVLGYLLWFLSFVYLLRKEAKYFWRTSDCHVDSTVLQNLLLLCLFYSFFLKILVQFNHLIILGRQFKCQKCPSSSSHLSRLSPGRNGSSVQFLYTGAVELVHLLLICGAEITIFKYHFLISTFPF